MVEKFVDKDAKNGNFSNQMKLCKRSTECVVFLVIWEREIPLELLLKGSKNSNTGAMILQVSLLYKTTKLFFVKKLARCLFLEWKWKNLDGKLLSRLPRQDGPHMER